jgi:transcriptional/translational regulatory protein YebC/TACO1
MEVLCSPSLFEPVKIALESAQLQAVLAEITYRPEITVALAAAEAEKMQKILDVLDELDDVQEVYHNAEL